MENLMELESEFEFEDSEWSDEGEVFSEAELIELAGELLSVESEAELDQFLGNLVRRAGRAAGKFVRSPMGQNIGRFLKGAAKKALPVVGTVVGAKFGGPLGAKIGRGVATFAANALELEMLEVEDQEFEGAKQFVRMGGAAVQSALAAPPNMPPQQAAQRAITTAAARFTPSLFTKGGPSSAIRRRPSGRGQSGQWVRRGRNIILMNVN
jgi:hypothetical protein